MVKTAYFYGKEADQFAFITMPKVLFDDPDYRGLACEAKVLYGMMLDRMALSIKNDWYDEDGKAYIRIGEDFIIDKLCCGRNKALNLMKQLEEYDLIERKKLGQGKNSIIFVKRFIKDSEVENSTVEESTLVQGSAVEHRSVTVGEGDPVDETFQEFENQTSGGVVAFCEIYAENSQKFENETSSQNDDNPEVYNLNNKKFKNQTSRSLEIKQQEVYFSNPNNTNINNTIYNNTKSNLILSTKERYDERLDGDETLKAYQSIVKENIDYDTLMKAYPYEQETIEGIYQLIVEILVSENDQILIASSWYNASLVKSKFLKLNYMHIEYVLGRLHANTTRVRNIKKYILASLFNAPSTMDSFYRAEVNADFPQYVAK